jgi:putative peptide zinc metalloprotease protein
MSGSASLLSPHWYRVAYLKPRLRSGVRISRQQVRGRTWHVLTDPVSGRHHRFNGAAYALIAGCDGVLTIDDIWAQRVDADGDDAPTQAQAIEVFAQGFGANLLGGDVAPDAAAVMRAQGKRRSQRQRAALNPLAFKLPLWDPDRFLDTHVRHVAWCFGSLGRRLWLLLMLLGALLLAANAGEFSRHAAAHLWHGRMLILLWIAYPLVKLLHELAHAFAVKAFGGEVHEVGITMLLLTPVPYVDASASVAFEDKRERVIVAGAGIALEWLIASAALALWLLLEPGLLRDAAFAVAFVGGVSTLMLNGNPLLRFDGYHVLCDAFELPNLAQRSARWWQSAAKRLALGRRSEAAESARGSERAWLVAYAPASWLYRGALTLLLALAVADWNAWLGLALLALALWWTGLGPLFAALRWLVGSGELHGRRTRAWALGSSVLAAGAMLAWWVPLPHRTLAPGVVWLPDEALVRPGADGFIEQVLVRDGETVTAGAPLLRLSNDPLRLALRKVEAELQQQQVEHLVMLDSDALRAGQAADRVAALVAERLRLTERVAALEVRAGTGGRVAINTRSLVVGRHLTQGQVAAHVLPPGAPLVRALVSNQDIALVRAQPGRIDVSLAHDAQALLAAQWQRSVPRATHELITPALGESAGGPIALDLAKDAQGRTAIEPWFEVELRLPEGVNAHVGARAWVSFRHGDATLAELSSQFLRRAFLRHFRT